MAMPAVGPGYESQAAPKPARRPFPNMMDGSDASGDATSLVRLVDLSDLDFSSDPTDEIGISMALSGRFELKMRADGRSVDVVPRVGQFGLLTPGHPAAISVRGECQVLQLRLPLRQLQHWWSEDGGVDGTKVQLATAHSLTNALIASQMCVAWKLGKDVSEEHFRLIAMELLNLSQRRLTKAGPMRGGLTARQLRTVFTYIDEHLSRSISLKDLAAKVRLSPFHFAREFKWSTGRAPYEHVIQRRLLFAMSLLRKSDLSLEAVARQAGFSHGSHLSRHLNRAIGQAPSRFRQHW